MPTRPPLHNPIVWRPPGAEKSARRADPYYQTEEWRALRLATLKRDHFRCRMALPKCEGRARVAHHVVDRSQGGRDDLSNLLSSCFSCHNAAHPTKGGSHA
jgi:5-methylcytosine-specific restriction endonuclease McrA